MTVNVAQVATELWINGGSAAYETTTPTIVQSYYGRSNSSITLTFGTTPTVGNLLLAIVIGSFESVMKIATSPGDGWGINSSLQFGYTGQNNFSAVLTKLAAADETGISISNLLDYTNVAMYEITGDGQIVFSTSGVNTSANTETTTTGSFPSRASNTLRLLAMEWQSALSITDTPSGYTVLSPTSWNSAISAGANAGIIYEASDPTSTGPVSVTTSIDVPASTSIFQVVDIAGQTNTGSSSGGGDQRPQILQTVAADVNGSSLTISLPTPTMAGNLLILVVINSIGTTTVSGWTLETSQGADGQQLYVYSKVSAGNDGTATISGPSPERAFMLELANYQTPQYSSGQFVSDTPSPWYNIFAGSPLTEQTQSVLNIIIMAAQNALYPVGICLDWYQLSPSIWTENLDSYSYNCLIFAAPGYYSGCPGVALGGQLPSILNTTWAIVSIEVDTVTIGNLGPGGGGGPYPPVSGEGFVAVMG